MIPDWIVQWVANAEGITPAQLQTIEDAIPAAQELLDVVKQAMPLITKATPLVAKVQPAAAIILAVATKIQQSG
jgi:hypothetical protein